MEAQPLMESEMYSKVKKTLNFNNFLKVVLIPCRDEFRKAQCDLWWTGNDFMNFKQAARNEIKLLAVFENICMTEARQKLYQPTKESLADDCQESGFSDDNDSEAQCSTKYRKTPVLSERKSLRTVSSVMCLPKVPSNGTMDSNEFYLDSETEYCLSLCVPLEEPGLLSTKERPSRKMQLSPFYQWLIMILTLLSFSLPLVGYYLLFFY